MVCPVLHPLVLGLDRATLSSTGDELRDDPLQLAKIMLLANPQFALDFGRPWPDGLKVDGRGADILDPVHEFHQVAEVETMNGRLDTDGKEVADPLPLFTEQRDGGGDSIQ